MDPACDLDTLPRHPVATKHARSNGVRLNFYIVFAAFVGTSHESPCCIQTLLWQDEYCSHNQPDFSTTDCDIFRTLVNPMVRDAAFKDTNRAIAYLKLRDTPIEIRWQKIIKFKVNNEHLLSMMPG